MARTKADIEKDWKKADTALIAALKGAQDRDNHDKLEAALAAVVKPWTQWNKLLTEATKKISEKDWKDDKKLDADRKKFKAWVGEQAKEAKKFEAEILAGQKVFAGLANLSRMNAALVVNIKARMLKAVADFKNTKDASGALATLFDLDGELLEVVGSESLKQTVIDEASKLRKALASTKTALEKAEKESLKIGGDIDAMTYQDIRNNPKLFKSYCLMIQKMEHHKFMEVSKFGTSVNESIYKKFIVPNTVNVSAKLLEKFNEIAASPKPDWSAAPWQSVVNEVDKMLRYPQQVKAFKEKLLAARTG